MTVAQTTTNPSERSADINPAVRAARLTRDHEQINQETRLCSKLPGAIGTIFAAQPRTDALVNAGQAARNALLVRRGYRTQQCPRPGTGCVQTAESARNRALAQALSRQEPAPQGVPAAVGDVDAQFLHQSRRQGSGCGPAIAPAGRKVGAARALRPPAALMAQWRRASSRSARGFASIESRVNVLI